MLDERIATDSILKGGVGFFLKAVWKVRKIYTKFSR